jgi:hypothetical protein
MINARGHQQQTKCPAVIQHSVSGIGKSMEILN